MSLSDLNGIYSSLRVKKKVAHQLGLPDTVSKTKLVENHIDYESYKKLDNGMIFTRKDFILIKTNMKLLKQPEEIYSCKRYKFSAKVWGKTVEWEYITEIEDWIPFSNFKFPNYDRLTQEQQNKLENIILLTLFKDQVNNVTI